MYFDENFIKSVLPEASVLYSKFPENIQFAIDTRTLKKGEIFVALQGATVDGHHFIEQALEAGAEGLLIDIKKRDILKKFPASMLNKKLVIAVNNPEQALYDLATAWRAQFKNPVVAVTGSVGKTSTKEMLAAIMRYHGKQIIASAGNQNTKLGVAINLLRLRETDECAIMEVGISARGEMDAKAAILKPDFAIITGIAHSHLEGLGAINDIANEKRAIFNYFSEKNIGIINGDQSLLSNVSYPHPVVRFGFKTTNQVQARKVRIHADHMNLVCKIYNEKFTLSLPFAHSGTLMNMLASSAAAYLLGVPSKTILEASGKSLVIPGRFERRRLNNHQGFLIHDAYNANPESTKAALATFQRIPCKAKKIVVLGDMLELGVNSPFWHRQMGRVLRRMSAETDIILVGSCVQWTKKALPVGASVNLAPTWQDAEKILQEKLTNRTIESLVLVKGSHGTGLYQLAEQMSESSVITK